MNKIMLIAALAFVPTTNLADPIPEVDAAVSCAGSSLPRDRCKSLMIQSRGRTETLHRRGKPGDTVDLNVHRCVDDYWPDWRAVASCGARAEGDIRNAWRIFDEIDELDGPKARLALRYCSDDNPGYAAGFATCMSAAKRIVQGQMDD